MNLVEVTNDLIHWMVEIVVEKRTRLPRTASVTESGCSEYSNRGEGGKFKGQNKGMGTYFSYIDSVFGDPLRSPDMDQYQHQL